MQQNVKVRKRKSSFAKRNEKWGFILLAPWLIGVVIFFVKPLIEAVLYSFNDVSLGMGSINMTWVGIDNYVYAMTSHATYYQELLTTFATAVPNSIIIVIFALFAAVLLNGDFKGRGVARVIFFLPIIMATDLISVDLGAALAGAAESSTEDETSNLMFLAGFLIQNTSLPKELVTGLLDLVSGVFETIKLSGVQTLIFLSALQTISPSHYEVAKIEGATTYETFWKVTLPMISPMILTCSIYTITDNLLDTSIVDLMAETGFNQTKYGLSSAMSVIFLICSLLVIGLTAVLIGKKVYYSD